MPHPPPLLRGLSSCNYIKLSLFFPSLLYFLSLSHSFLRQSLKSSRPKTHQVAENDLELVILLLQPPEGFDYRPAPP